VTPRRTPELEQLASELRLAADCGHLLGGASLDRVANLADQVLAQAREEWLPESAFRLRTGATARWCRRNHPRFLASGQARVEGGQRIWHASARAPRVRPADTASIVDEIVQSFEKAS